ncbi:TonB-dependent receptor [Pedobacter sp. SD-b]|uniref:TonB-dependent receptor n=1 Tax=Pedobacter segetis TaxID=2793069 RepID=A0ABS1BL46_9SPHI|nr:TonB-dependent receptor [Pedobacter segetis]MBK0383614.1 TonB-dependent receptor [Pedobacter segetis]
MTFLKLYPKLIKFHFIDLTMNVKFLLFVFLLFFAVNSYAKKSVVSEIKKAKSSILTVKGKVSDTDGQPLVGVVVTVKGQKINAQTNADGNYQITANPGDILVFSYLGFQTKEITVGSNTVINVKLEVNIGSLDEVVVVGYGTQKKSTLTGSVSSVDFKNLENIPQSSTLNILSGRVAGLSVVQQSGQPGDDGSEVSLRGPLNTDISDSSPLVIIDGVLSSLKDLSTLSPQQISNVSVLKDASATAIYGARGGNGVILVSTKTPAAGKMRVVFDSFYGLQKATYLPDFVESWQWMELQNQATNRLLFPLEAIDAVKKGILTDTFANNDPVKHVFRDAPMSNYNLAISGGSETLKFQGSIGYLDQEGIMKNTNSNRINYRSNLTSIVSKNLEIGGNLSGYFQNNHRGYYRTDQVLTQLYRSYPITPDTYSNGSPGVINLYNGTNIPPADLYQTLGSSNDKIQKNNYVTYLQLKPLKGLVLRSTISYSQQQNIGRDFLPTFSYADPSGTPAFINKINVLTNSSNTSKQFQISNTGVYSFKITKKGSSSVLLGQEYTNFKNEYFGSKGSNLPNNDQQELDRVTTDFNPFGNEYAWRLQSFFGRFNYNFDRKYFFEASFRADGSSRFPVTKRYSYFPSASAAWVVSNESFFKNLMGEKSVIDQLKFRFSIGKAGNDRIGNYSYQQTLNLDNYYYFGNNLSPGAAPRNYANPDIQWETTTSKDLGLDLTMLKGKLDLTADVYDRTTDGLLYTLPLAPSFGLINPAVQNIAVVNNRGYEFDLHYRGGSGKFRYNIGGNLAYVKNKIVDLKGVTAISGANILEEGQDVNAFYGYKTNGLFRTAEDVANYPSYSRGFILGSLKYVDLNGDKVINDDDRTVLGTGSTPYTYGISGGASYKNFDFSFLMQGVQGKSVYTYDWGNRPGNAGILNFWQQWYDDRFDATNNPNGTYPALGRGVPALVSDFYVRNASYIRLKNVEIGYSLTQKSSNKIGISSLRFYVSGQNIFTVTPLIHQIDPERAARLNGNTNYPQTSVFTAGLNASF